MHENTFILDIQKVTPTDVTLVTNITAYIILKFLLSKLGEETSECGESV